MSCHMVESEHIHVLIWAALHAGGPATDLMYLPTDDEPTDTNAVEPSRPSNIRVLRRGTETGVGQMLVDANALSVRTRYKLDDESDEGYVYEYSTPKDTWWSPVELLSALNGFEYQVCETVQWRESEAKLFCGLLRRRIESRLPGASDGPWSIRADCRSALTMAAPTSVSSGNFFPLSKSADARAHISPTFR